jgi:hypothetical protein
MNLWTAVLTCHDCGVELNRATHVPENKKGVVAASSPLAAKPCPRGCNPSFSDCNINTDLTWVEEPAPPKADPLSLCSSGMMGSGPADPDD